MCVKIHNTLISIDHCAINIDSKRHPIVGAMHFVCGNVIVSNPYHYQITIAETTVVLDLIATK